MKGFSRRSLIMISSLIVILVTIAFYTTWQARSQAQPWMDPTYSTVQPTPTRPPWCKPLPYESDIIGTPTSTPNVFSQKTPAMLPTQLTPTPYPIAHVIDLAPEIPGNEKGIAYVYRCNGEIDEYLFGAITYSELVDQVDLKEGDIVSLVPPTANFGHEILPPESTLQFPTNSVPTISLPTSIIKQTPD